MLSVVVVGCRQTLKCGRVSRWSGFDEGDPVSFFGCFDGLFL